MFEVDDYWQHRFLWSVGSGDRLLLIASGAVHHNRGAQKEEKQKSKKLVVCSIIIATLCGQGGEKEGMVQGLATKTKWKSKPCNQFTWTATWSWIRLDKLHVDGPKNLSEVLLLFSSICECLPSHCTSLGSVATVLSVKGSHLSQWQLFLSNKSTYNWPSWQGR